jgi:hypothetical protein
VRVLPTTVNAQLAFAVYSLDPELGCYLPAALDVVALRGNRIAHIIAFRSPEPFTRSACRTA